MRTYLGPTTLEALERRFTELTAEPAPLTLNGHDIGFGLPEHPIKLDTLRITLLKHRTGPQVKDAVWAELLRRAHEQGEPWITAAIGMALPGLKRIAGDTARNFRGDIADFDSEIVEGFLAALNQADPKKPKVYSSLYFMAKRYGQEARLSADRTAGRNTEYSEGVVQRYSPTVTGHPDLVLARAVREHAISEREAGLILRANLDGEDRAALTEDHGLSPYQFRRMLTRAQRRVKEFLDSTLPPRAA